MALRIGVMVRRLRKQLKITQKSLGRGIISKAQLSRIEQEEREPGFFELCALMQRLGKSMRSFELVVSGAEYRLLCLRQTIYQNLLAGDLNEAEGNLKRYEKMSGNKKIIHRQYVMMHQAVKSFLEKRDTIMSLKLLKDAASLSQSDLSELPRVESCLHRQELQVLFLIVYMYIEQKEYDTANLVLERIQACMERWHPAEEIAEEMYPQYLYLLTKCRCREAEFSQEDILDLIVMGELQNVIPENELLKKTRIAKGWSQEELSEGICARETVSKIENGRVPNKKTLKELLEKLGIEREIITMKFS